MSSWQWIKVDTTARSVEARVREDGVDVFPPVHLLASSRALLNGEDVAIDLGEDDADAVGEADQIRRDGVVLRWSPDQHGEQRLQVDASERRPCHGAVAGGLPRPEGEHGPPRESEPQPAAAAALRRYEEAVVRPSPAGRRRVEHRQRVAAHVALEDLGAPDAGEVDRVPHLDAGLPDLDGIIGIGVLALERDRVAPGAGLRGVDGRGGVAVAAGGHDRDEEGGAVAVAVVAAVGGAEHRRGPVEVLEVAREVEPPPAPRHGVPDDELVLRRVAREHGAEEDEAVAGVERVPVAVVGVGEAAEGRGGGEPGAAGVFTELGEEEAEEGARRPAAEVELAVAAEEDGVGGEEPPPWLADEGAADEQRGVARWEAEEDLADDVVVQLRRQRTAAAAALRRRRSRHADETRAR